MKNKDRNEKIGGQALIEGIMMRKKSNISVAVRMKNNDIYVKTFKINFLDKFKFYRKIPIIRGIIEMIASLIIGYRCLLISAEKSMVDENYNSYDSDKSFKEFGVIEAFSSVFGVILAISIFMFLPSFFVKQFEKFLYVNNIFKSLFEGLIKISIFIGYIFIMSNIKDIKRTFMYHGAEHKTIACFEKGEELTVENIAKKTRFHPRCGTNFIFIVLIISIIIFSFLSWKNILTRLLFKFSLLPIITGLSYEIIRLAGKKENILTKILVTPGLLLQRLTTKEPDKKQIEVAIKSVEELLKNDY